MKRLLTFAVVLVLSPVIIAATAILYAVCEMQPIRAEEFEE